MVSEKRGDGSDPVSHLDCAAVSLFFVLFYSFILIDFLFYFLFFLTYRTMKQGWATERWLRDRCAHEVADG
jgi:hypothetical protein